MGRKVAPTASNLSTHKYKFISVDPLTGLMALSGAGVAPSGVLLQVYSSAGVQFGIYDDSDVVTMKGAAAIAKGAEVQSDAAGLAISNGPGFPAGVAQTACLGAGKSFSLRLFPAASPGIGTLAAPANEVVYGTGTATASSPHAKFTPATATAALTDTAGVATQTVSGDVAVRTVSVTDAAGVVMSEEDTKLANRVARIFDSVGTVLAKLDTKVAGRLLDLNDTLGHPIVEVNAVAGSEKVTLGNLGVTASVIFDRVNALLKGLNAAGTGLWLLHLATGVVSTPSTNPAVCGAVENNYALATGLYNNITANAAGTAMTGIVAEADGARKILCNVSTKGLTLNDQDNGSIAANRIQTTTGAPVLVAPKASVELIYDGTLGFWRMLWVT